MHLLNALQLLSHKSKCRRWYWRALKAFTCTTGEIGPCHIRAAKCSFFVLNFCMTWIETVTKRQRRAAWEKKNPPHPHHHQKKKNQQRICIERPTYLKQRERNILYRVRLFFLLAPSRTSNLPGRLLFTSGCCRRRIAERLNTEPNFNPFSGFYNCFSGRCCGRPCAAVLE